MAFASWSDSSFWRHHFAPPPLKCFPALYFFAFYRSLASLVDFFCREFFPPGEALCFLSSSMDISVFPAYYRFALDNVIPRGLFVFGTYGAHALGPSLVYFAVHFFFLVLDIFHNE